MDLLEMFSLSQHVSGPTHLLGHTLDLIITRLPDDVVLASPKATFPISDHFIIHVHWDNIDALSDCFNMTLTDILDKHAPLKTRIMINRPKIPWFNADIKQLKHKRRRLEKKALKTDLPGDWNNYHKMALPEHNDPTKLANEFGTFFLQKIEIIKENLDKFQVQEPRLAPVTTKENLENFPSLSKGEGC
ncbi:unnamed protein product [Porites evermanni]|uniref:Uncharacterized protein n=1 Tax=Porites evermanni TaxID=104178 RepID=A0ABN8LXT5_9CNID|nr:unnamed protein product [Porites evermanni]